MMCLEELEAELQAYEISARTGRDARKDLEDQLIYGWYQSRKTISLKKILKQLHWQKKELAVAMRIEPLACRQCQRNLHRRKNDARGDEQMSNYEIPYWKKYTLSIEEAAAYFRIGEGKLRNW